MDIDIKDPSMFEQALPTFHNMPSPPPSARQSRQAQLQATYPSQHTPRYNVPF